LHTGGLDAATAATAKPSRLAHFDWMRGLACVLMFQTHCYDAWLSPAARTGKFFMGSQLLGTFPAPLFLFLTGISAVLMGKKISGGGPPSAAATRLIKRGFEIWGLGLLFRLQEYLIAFPWAPWTDLLRMDVLNCLGVSLLLVGLLFSISPTWSRVSATAAASSAAVSMLAPLIWTHHFRWLPWFVETYLNGVHNLGKPQAWLFPIFPWSAFAFAGVVAGQLALSDRAKNFPRARVAVSAATGLVVCALAYGFEHGPLSLYPSATHDFWHTSPNFFLLRLGFLLLILAVCDLRCQLRPIVIQSKALVLLGQHSLLVYWMHIEFVYGRLHILPRHGLSIAGATGGLAVITFSMLLLAYFRSRRSVTHRVENTSQVTAAS
jgi:uncharacterized membrane protein